MPRQNAQHNNTVRALLRRQIGSGRRIAVRTAIGRQCINRTPQITNRLSVAHPRLKNRGECFLIEGQIRRLENKIGHRELRIVSVLLIRRRSILNANLRRRRLPGNIRAGTCERRRSKGSSPRTRKGRTGSRRQPPARSNMPHIIHFFTHDRTNSH